MTDFPQEPGEIIEDKPNDTHSAAKVIALFVAVCALVALLFYFYTKDERAPAPGGGADDPRSEEPADGALTTISPQEMGLTGKIYFNDDAENRRSYLRVYDIETGEFSDIEEVGEDGYDQNPRVLENPEGGSREIVYLHGTFDPESGGDYPLSGPRTITSFDLMTGETEVLSRTTVGYRRQMAVAEEAQRRIASVGLRPDFKGDANIDIDAAELADYSVYAITENGIEKEIGHGFWPSWSADGERLYFVRRSGIYRYDVQSENIDELFSKDNWHLDFASPGIVSPDERYFVGYDPGPREIHVYRIASVEPFVFELTDSYQTYSGGRFLTPSFAADSKTLLYTETRDEWNTASVIAIDLEDQTQTKLFDVEIENRYALFPYLF